MSTGTHIIHVQNPEVTSQCVIICITITVVTTIQLEYIIPHL